MLRNKLKITITCNFGCVSDQSMSGSVNEYRKSYKQIKLESKIPLNEK